MVTAMALQEIAQAVRKGKMREVPTLVQAELDAGTEARTILENGLLSGMKEIGEAFAANKAFVPEVMLAAKAMQSGVDLLKEGLKDGDTKAAGKVCLGTVFGDRHDIGKNLVKIMLEGRGLTVIDLGVNVSAETFVNTAEQEGCDIIACSALLTTTMPQMKKVVDLLDARGLRDRIKVMVGGAPVNEEFARSISADLYTPDAASAAEKAVELLAK